MTTAEKKENILIAAGIYGIIAEVLPTEIDIIATLFLFVFLGMTIMILLNKTPKIIMDISSKAPIMTIVLTNLGVPACMDVLFFLGFIPVVNFCSPSTAETYRDLSNIAVYATLCVAILAMIVGIYKYVSQKNK